MPAEVPPQPTTNEAAAKMANGNRCSLDNIANPRQFKTMAKIRFVATLACQSIKAIVSEKRRNAAELRAGAKWVRALEMRHFSVAQRDIAFANSARTIN
jgi:hypothetical protein